MKNNSLENLNLIIPMAGSGSRFKNKGYKEFKPFIKIDQKYMVEKIIDNFPEYVEKWVITCKEYLKDSEIEFLKTKNTNVIYIDPHKEGPAYSIIQASKELPLDQSFFISYCDIDWTWNFNDTKSELDKDGIIFTHSSFHPHKLINNKSAFCKEKENRLIEIKEKESFTSNWMNEPLSIGLFFVKNGHEMINSIKNLIKKNIRVNDEFFPSLIFNEMVNNKKKILLKEVDYFIHWGIPEQLEDFKEWEVKIKKIRNFNTKQTKYFDSLICMGGTGSRMSNLKLGYKGFIKINKIPMFKFVSGFFLGKNNTVITYKDIFVKNKTKFNNFRKIIFDKKTSSQLETLIKVKQKIFKQKNFFLLSCDAFSFLDYNKLLSTISKEDSDAVIFLFKPSLINSIDKKSHTYVTIQSNKIKSINIKKKKKIDDLGLAGFFWFADGKVFKEISNVKSDKKNEMSIDHFIIHLINLKKKISYVILDYYCHLGTEKEYLEFDFWNKNIN